MLTSPLQPGPLLLVFISVLAGCTAGALDQPSESHPAMNLRVQLAGTPPDAATYIRVSLTEIPYCPASDVSGVLPIEPRDAPVETDLAPWQHLNSGPDGITPVTVSSGGDPRAFGCVQWVPLIRFFRPELVSAPGLPDRPWDDPWTAPDTIIAYTMEAATFTPFGPEDAPITLPPGYSILRRTCGSTEPWQLQVVSPSEPVVFQPPAAYVPLPQPLPSPSAVLESTERAMLSDCPAGLPPADLGRRVSFDRPISLAFSADAQQLYMLMPADPGDPQHAAALRSVNVADGSLQQVIDVPLGRRVTITDNGDLYVATQTSLVRVDRQANGTDLGTTLPIPGGLVSPDGRWIAYWDSSSDNAPSGVALKIWDVAAAEARVIDESGIPVRWTPSSLLLQEEFGQNRVDAYLLRDPSSGQLIQRYSFSSMGYGREVFWGTEGPLLLEAPILWTPQQPVARAKWVTYQGPDERDFGLTINDLRTGDVRMAIGPGAGSVSFAATAPGFAFVWTRKCMGLFETVCGFTLHQVDLGAGTDKVVALAGSEASVAVSRTADRVAIVARDGIYIKDLP